VIVDYFAIPAGGDAEYLLSGLARLIELRGCETFLSAPVLLAEPRFFPDKVKPRADGVAVLLQRLLAYANIEPKGLEIQIYPARDELLVRSNPNEHPGAAAWFLDIEDGVYRFGVRDSELRDEQSLIGTLGHEVAHAYRTYHRICVSDRDVEEKLTDLTTVYLGFGAFTLASSFQFKTGHYSHTGERLAYERQARGYLTPGQLAFLLAAQLVVRRDRENLLKQVRASLPLNHAHAVQTAYEQLASNDLELFEALRLPPISAWPPVHQLELVLSELPPVSVVLNDDAKPASRAERRETIAFRVAGTSAVAGMLAGACLGFTVSIYSDLRSSFWPVVAGLAALGFFMGRRRVTPRCSSCSHRVAPASDRCAFCSKVLVGDIADAMDRLAAEDTYFAQSRSAMAEDE
jgi:hypothetical protein